MSNSRESYRQIIKATSIFGGVQIFQIIIGIIRSKFIAILLGPSGMGISGLLQSSIGLIQGLTNFGLSTSAVKTISAAQAEGDETKMGKVIAVFRRLVWGTGLLGLIVTLFLSSYLSQINFGKSDYTWAFALLSLTLLINQISAGQSVLLRATRQINLMAKSSILGNLIGLVTTIPFYYVYGIDGIVPAIIMAALISLFLTWYFSKKVSFKDVKINFSDLKLEGKEMLAMGFMISLSGIINLVFSYIVKIFISNHGSVGHVGLYNAGFAIVNTYVGMFFTAMSTDYYPKLSGVVDDIDKRNQTINQQAEIAILILSPLIIVFIVFIKWVIFLLYSESFLNVDKMIIYAAAGMLFKTLSWSIAFLFLAKSARKLFFWNELISNSYMLGLNLAGYYWFGLTGLGISFLIAYFLYSIQVFLLSKKLFSYKINQELIKIFFINLCLTTLCLLFVINIKNNYLLYFLGFNLLVGSASFNFYNLNRRMSFRLKLF